METFGLHGDLICKYNIHWPNIYLTLFTLTRARLYTHCEYSRHSPWKWRVARVNCTKVDF